MKAIDLLKSQDNILLVDSNESKKVQALSSTLNELMVEMNNQINSFEKFKDSQLNGEYNDKIVIAKSLANFFKDNKQLKVELAVQALENEEKAQINQYYTVKTKLLETIRNIINNSTKEAVVCNYDLFEGEFAKCETNHEIIILNGRNTTVLETLYSELDTELIVNGNFETIEPQSVDYSLDTLNRNIDLCRRKNNEIFGSKTGKLNKINSVIEKLKEVGERVVSFYSYKSSLEIIGCNPKGIKDYENELSKAYIPLKKTLQKELKIELEDICNVTVNEDEYQSVDIDEDRTNNEFTSPLESSGFISNDEIESPSLPSNEVTDLPNTQESPSFETPTEDINPFDTITTQTSPFDNVNSFETNPFDTPSSDSTDPFESDNIPQDPFAVERKNNPFDDLN